MGRSEPVRRDRVPADDGGSGNGAADHTRLVLYAAALRRPDDLLELVLERMQAYNTIVAEVISEAKSHSARIMKYVGDGVLMSFPPDDVTEALRCVGRIVEQLGLLQELPGGGEIESCMGLSAGKVLDVNYLPTAVSNVPPDFVGEPIEIATRLVSDVAKPRQILLDRSAREHVEGRHLTELDPPMPDAELLPVKGQSLMIQGMRKSIPVFELVWQGQEEREIHNRQLLWRELTEIRQATLRLRFAIEDGEPMEDKKAVSDLGELLQQLDPRRPLSEIAYLKNSVDRSVEAKKISVLVADMSAIEVSFTELSKAWTDHRKAVRFGNEGAIEAVCDAYDELKFAVRKLDVEVEVQVERQLSPVGESV